MTPLSPTELAAIDAAVRAGRVQRAPRRPIRGQVMWEHLINDGEFLAGEPCRKRIEFSQAALRCFRGRSA